MAIFFRSDFTNDQRVGDLRRQCGMVADVENYILMVI